MNQIEKLRQFTAAIENDVLDERERILEVVRREVDSAISAAKDEFLAETYRYIKNEVARERTEMGRSLSRRMMDNKNKLNQRREEMGEVVMGKVSEKLAEYVETEEYVDKLIDTAHSILDAFYGAETVLYLREDDLKHKDKLLKALKSEYVSIEQGNFSLGGMIGICPAVHVQIDATFDSKFSEMDGHFAEMFGLQLSQ